MSGRIVDLMIQVRLCADARQAEHRDPDGRAGASTAGPRIRGKLSVAGLG